MKIIHDNDKISRDIERAFHNGNYIVSFKSVYQPFYSVNAGYYAQEVYRSSGPMTMAGRFFHFPGEYVNSIIGIDLLNNLNAE